jgi:putative ABC transport system permease protein
VEKKKTMFDFLHEIFATMRRNKLRTLLTGFAIAWGIFMLIVLLGAGNGFRNGVTSNFEGQAMNTVTIYGGRTNIPYGGYKAGRRIILDMRDVEFLRLHVPEIEFISPSISHWGADITYGKGSTDKQIDGVSPDAAIIEGVRIESGRFINDADVAMRRKVVVINSAVGSVLFRGEEPVGKWVNIDNVPFRVVGVNDDRSPWGSLYVPYTTALTLYSPSGELYKIGFTVRGIDSVQAGEEFDRSLARMLSARHKYHPDDRALYIYNAASGALRMNRVFSMINVFILIIGLACLMAGVVGVGNIMLITVKERTREIGIRKALGATPASVLRLIIAEAVFITACAGYVGILLGVIVTETAASIIGKGGGERLTMFVDPTVGLGTAVSATLFMMACGVVAGLIPALKATRVRPIEAMRAE